MPFDSQGTFTRKHNWEDDRINDIEIVTDHHDDEDDNFAEALSQTFLRDGRVAMKGNLNLGNYQIKNLANGLLKSDAVTMSQLVDVQEKAQEALDDLKQELNTAIDGVLPKSVVGECVLSAPNGLPRCSGNTIVVSAGLKVLIPNGRNADDTLKTITYTLPHNITMTVKSGSNLYLLLYDTGQCALVNHHGEYPSAPKSRYTGDHYYNTNTNFLYESNADGSWKQVSAAVIAKNITGTGTSASGFTACSPLRLLQERDQSLIVNWVAPDYAAGVSVSSGFEAPVCGWAYLNAYGTDQIHNKIYVNGKEIFNPYREHIDKTPATLFLGKGDVVTYTGGTITGIFYPARGAY